MGGVREDRLSSARTLGPVTVLAVMLALAFPATGLAGRWMVVSCINPDGSAAPSEGWSGSSAGSLPFGSFANTRCTPQLPMQAALVATAPAPDLAEENLQYAPPPGSELIGGSVTVGLHPYGYGTGAQGYTWSSASVLEPGSEPDTANALISCVALQTSCGNGTDVYVGNVILPSEAGGDLYVETECSGFNPSAGACDTGAGNSEWSLAEVISARLLLRNDAVPTGSSFRGAVLRPNASGDARLAFVATDPAGPGVFLVSATVDGRTVYQGTPDTEDGSCQPVGTDSATGALMFDHQQPCPAVALIALGIPTEGLHDGAHRLVVTVTDAAGNSAVVLNRRITIRNSSITRARGPRLGHMRLSLRWHWDGRRTRLLAEHISGLPRASRLSLRCSGAGCPRVSVAAKASPQAVLRALRHRTFRAADRLLLSISSPHRPRIRVLVTIRSGRHPTLRVLR